MTLRVTPDSSKSSKGCFVEDRSPWNFSQRPLTPPTRPQTPDAWTPWTPHSEPAPKNQLGTQADLTASVGVAGKGATSSSPAATKYFEMITSLLKVLPDDAPSDHRAHQECKNTRDWNGAPIIIFRTPTGGKTTSFQISHAKCGGFVEVAFRMARVCFMKFSEGASMAEVRELRNQCYSDLEQAMQARAAANAGSIGEAASTSSSSQALVARLGAKRACETKETSVMDCLMTPTRPHTKRRRGQEACAEDGGAIVSDLGTNVSTDDRRREFEKFLLDHLPEDAPLDDQAHKRIHATTERNRKVIKFAYGKNCEDRMHLMVSYSKCGGSEEAAKRIMRICYMKAATGASSVEVRALLAELLGKVRAAIETKQQDDPMTPLKTPSRFAESIRKSVPLADAAKDAEKAGDHLPADAAADVDPKAKTALAAPSSPLSKAVSRTKISSKQGSEKAQKALTRRRPKLPTPPAAYKRVNRDMLPFRAPPEPSTPGSSLPPTPATLPSTPATLKLHPSPAAGHPSPAASTPSICVAVPEQILRELTKTWWSCPLCSFHIPTTWTQAKKRGFKMFHMLGHGHGMKNQSKFATRQPMLRAVWRGSFKKTQGRCGLTKDKLRVNALGRLVPVKRSEHSRKIGINSGWTRKMQCWKRAFKQVYVAEGATGFMKLKKNGTEIEQLHYKQVYAAFQEELARTPEPPHIGPKQQKITGFLVSIKREDAAEIQVE